MEQWQVSLGSETQSTTLAMIPQAGFTGWLYRAGWTRAPANPA
jgi:hypothetical protein